jgi:hypothetical protein
MCKFVNGFLIMALCMLIFSTAFTADSLYAAPKYPAADFYGTVTVNGISIPNGTSIIAMIGNRVRIENVALVIVLAKRVNTRLNETRNLGRRRSFLGGSAG